MSSPVPLEEVRVQLNFVGFVREPDEVTRLVGIVPSKVWRIGEPIDKSIRTYKSNGWRVSATPPVIQVEAGVDTLFADLAPHWVALRQFSQECRVELSIVIYAAEQIPAIHLRREQIVLLEELGGSVDVDVYCLGRQDE